MTKAGYRNIFTSSRPRCKGRLISVMRRGAGSGGRCRAQDVRPVTEAQAAMIRLTGRGSPAEDTKLAAPARASVLRGCRRASHSHRARDAGKPADLRPLRLRQASVPRGAGVRGSLGIPAFRAPLIGAGIEGRTAYPAPQTIRAMTRARSSFRGAPQARTRNPDAGGERVSGFRVRRFAPSRNDEEGAQARYAVADLDFRLSMPSLPFTTRRKKD